jgi:hypothetical protein
VSKNVYLLAKLNNPIRNINAIGQDSSPQPEKGQRKVSRGFFRSPIHLYIGFASKSFSWGQGVGCRVWGVGCGVWGVGCGVWGFTDFEVVNYLAHS